jgi:hypothetical protein
MEELPMKFLKEDGSIEEGFALSDVQVERRQKIQDFLHEKVCSGYYHSPYGTPAKCGSLANQLIVLLNAPVVAELVRVIEILTPNPVEDVPEPRQPIAVVEPITATVQLPTPEPAPANPPTR